MTLGRRALIWILSPLLTFFLFALALDWGAVSIIGHPGSVKKILNDSGIYSSIVPNALAQAGQINTSIGDISAKDPLVMQAAQQSIPPAQVQKNVEAAIDNVYEWLDGKIAQPSFDINLAGSQADFAKTLSNLAQQRLASLPPCTTGLTVTSFDALNATCLPPGLSAQAVTDRLQADVASSNVLAQTSVSAHDIKGNTPGQSIFADQLHGAPNQYRRLKKAPPLIALLAILTAIALVILRPTWRSGLRHVGTSVLIVGILMLVFAWLFNTAISKKIVPNIKVDNTALQANLRRGVTDLSQRIEHNYYLFGYIYAAVGMVMIAAPFTIRARPADDRLVGQEGSKTSDKKKAGKASSL